MYLMRQKSCQGLCDQVTGIPEDLMAHTRQGNDEGHFVTRISQEKELCLLVLHARQNCSDATERMIKERMKDNGEPIYTASWVTLVLDVIEFCSVGIRDFDAPEIDLKLSYHLGHVHVLCTRFSDIIADRYEDAFCGGTDSIAFKNGTAPEKRAKWRMLISNGDCAESKIEEAMGLRAGGLHCLFDEWFELDTFA
ncbi:hypothetical protein B0J13DRAFT_629186 [Dactylonectria estremocensis]|uniref:Uncharacterized protein n=1 Tax=Dactylonectria estremocensis TaxID=1079267 RepID=A0A9P9DGR6_9HYPO|nr:hypothetical protein B0J13DRAFT_629186 [Dactylonectria estremocensis]